MLVDRKPFLHILSDHQLYINSTGASHTKWAIEYEEPAGQAFGENHPEAAVFVENCNVILKYGIPFISFGF
jgi:hypothetical protein